MKQLIILFLLFNISINAQNFKKEIFLDINKDTITSELFLKKIKRTDIGYSVFESDSINTLKLVKADFRYDLFEKYKVGKIDSLKKTKIISELKLLVNNDIDTSNIIVVNFYIDEKAINQRSCIDFYLNHSSHRNFFKKKRYSDVKQFFITDQSYFYENKKVFRDENKTIQNLFFSDASRCGNYIIIFPDNSYVLKIGEYRQEVILEFIKDFKKNDK